VAVPANSEALIDPGQQEKAMARKAAYELRAREIALLRAKV
jgi:hypothetical protein